jgi:hypothetical protein
VDGHPGTATRRAPILLISAVLTFVNLTALLWEVEWVIAYYNDSHGYETYIVDQEFWEPFVLVMWTQAIVNGLVLLPWRKTRRVGLGILVGTVCAVVALVLVIVLFVLPQLG